MSERPRYWFRARIYGWGWGLPCRWEGWAVYAGYLALLFAGIFMIRPREHPAGFVLYVSALSLILVGICWRTGEPPRWRWGKD